MSGSGNIQPGSEARRQIPILDPIRKADFATAMVQVNRMLDNVMTGASHVLVVFDPIAPHQARLIGVGDTVKQREALRAILTQLDATAGTTGA